MLGLVFLKTVCSGDLSDRFRWLQKDGFSQRCIQRLSEHSLVLMFYRTMGCQAFFLKTIFHVPPVCLIWRASPSIFLAHGLSHGSGQLFLFSLVVVASQKCFYSCGGKHTLISFPTESRKRQKGIQFVLPGQHKENVHSIKLRLWVKIVEIKIVDASSTLGHGHVFSVYKMKKRCTLFKWSKQENVLVKVHCPTIF